MFLYKPTLDNAPEDTPNSMSLAIGTSKFKSILCCPATILSVVSSITLPPLFLNSKVILFEPSEYIIADFIIQSLLASKIKCWSPLKKPPVPNVLSKAPPNHKVVLAKGSKLVALGFVHPNIADIHDPSSKHAEES